jgi:hypothetical protein
VIIELLSESTRAIDKGEKKALYERVFRTGEYYLYDLFSQELLGYHLRGTHYAEVPWDEEGKIYSPTTGLYLVVRDQWLRWMSPEGVLLPTPTELAAQERQRAEQERQRADQAERRAEQAERLLAEYQRRFGELE